MNPADIKIIEEWYEVKISKFIKEFEDYYKNNANLELHLQTLYNLNTELNNTLEFEDENKNKISTEELAYLREQDSHIPKLSGISQLLNSGKQDYWLCPTLPYFINKKKLYKTKEYLELTNKIERLQPLINISKLTIEEYTIEQLKFKLARAETYTFQVKNVYNKINKHINNLCEEYEKSEEYKKCGEYGEWSIDAINNYKEYSENRIIKIKEELQKASVIEEIQKKI